MTQEKQIDYDAIPVVYCRRCHSLHIIAGNDYPDYCGICGSTDLGNATIEEWLADENKK